MRARKPCSFARCRLLGLVCLLGHYSKGSLALGGQDGRRCDRSGCELEPRPSGLIPSTRKRHGATTCRDYTDRNARQPRRRVDDTVTPDGPPPMLGRQRHDRRLPTHRYARRPGRRRRGRSASSAQAGLPADDRLRAGRHHAARPPSCRRPTRIPTALSAGSSSPSSTSRRATSPASRARSWSSARCPGRPDPATGGRRGRVAGRSDRLTPEIARYSPGVSVIPVAGLQRPVLVLAAPGPGEWPRERTRPGSICWSGNPAQTDPKGSIRGRLPCLAVCGIGCPRPT